MLGIIPSAGFVGKRPLGPINGNFEFAPTFVAGTSTTNRFIDGTAGGSQTDQSFGSWSVTNGGALATSEAYFDSTVSRSGGFSMRLATLDATGTMTVSNARNASSPLASEAFVLLPSTTYTLSMWIKTNNVAASSAFFDIRTYTSALTTVTTVSSAKKTGTNDWAQVSLQFTTGATVAYGVILLRNNIAGNVSQAWFDDISLRKG